VDLHRVTTGAREHEIPSTYVLPWLRGYLACLGRDDDSSQLAARIIPQITPLDGESFHQTCYRALKVCHDQGIIVYRGIRRE